MQGVTTVILAGGQGARLFPLTRDRAKPGVPFGGKYRLVDIAMSNCIHSELNRIFILTQFNSASLNRHISETYMLGSIARFSVQILAAEQTPRNRGWYQGTADAVRQSLRHMISPHHRPEHFLVLAGDHLYRMDYGSFVATHVDSDADLTIGVLPVSAEEAPRFGILSVDEDGWIHRFVEKPSSAAELEGLQADLPELAASDRSDRPYLASMGIYLLKTDVMVSLLESSDGVDFGHHVIPANVDNYRFRAHPFTGYWEDIGTIGAFYRANLGLLDTVPKFDFYNELAPIYTYLHHLANSKVNESHIRSSMLADGSIVDASEIRRSIIGVRSIVRAGSVVEESLIMGADYYESREEIDAAAARGLPPMGVGRDCIVRGAIVDKNARIGDGAVITNEAAVEHADAEDGSWHIRDGVAVIPKNAVIPAGATI